jgi:peptide-methionine (S)-S-oxide reductase
MLVYGARTHTALRVVRIDLEDVDAMRSPNGRKSPHSCTLQLILALAFGIGLAGCRQNLARIPDASLEPEVQAATINSETAVFSGGCFWGVDAVFKHVKGVTQVTSGYSGGSADTAQYETVSSGTTGHAESVQVIYDPSKVSYGTLLKVFFFVAHDPTELNRQGPDEGSQYRSIIFYTSEQQKKTAMSYITELDKDKAFSGPIVTEVVPLKHFYTAEDYHQDYFERHPKNPYIVFNDWSKVTKLRQQFASLYQQYDP